MSVVLYLYGSCARKEQDFNSDVDLLLKLGLTLIQKDTGML